MALPSTGAISLNQVNTELGRTATASINMNDAEVRELAGKPTGVISMNDLRGKAWWTLQVGDRWKMTSNNAPSPLAVEGNNNWYTGANHVEFWKAFTDAASTSVFFSRGDTNVYAYLWIDVGTAIKPKTFAVNMNHSYGTYGFVIEGSNDMTNWTNLYSSGLKTGTTNTTLEVTATQGFRYFRIGIYSGEDGTTQVTLYHFLLKQRYSK